MDQPSAAKQTEQMLAIIALTILIVVGLIYLVINPQLKQLSENNLEIAVIKKELQDKKEKLDNLKILVSKIEENKMLVRRLAIALPKQEKVSELLVQLSAMSKSAGLDLLSITPQTQTQVAAPPPAAASEEARTGEENTSQTSAGQTASSQPEVEIGSLGFSIETLGSYTSLNKFLNLVETNLRTIKISKITVASTEVSANPSLSMTFEMETNYQK